MTGGRLGASFRDPAGYMFVEGGTLYRRVNAGYAAGFDELVSSGLYRVLVDKGWLVSHEQQPVTEEDGSRIIRPEPIPYVSYPYEWSFSQLQDAALLTLHIQLSSLARGMTLKDASAFNVQFVGSRPVFIDTLSFEPYRDGQPWVAYRQFCQHFLAPLALRSHVDDRLGHLFRRYLDGIPLDLAVKMLPMATRLRPGLLLHLHGHARSQQRHARAGTGDAEAVRIRPLTKNRQIALLESLRQTVLSCRAPRQVTEWSHYYHDTSYSADAMSAKERLVCELVETVAGRARLLHDVGANTGRFSRLLAGPARYVVSHDVDEAAVEQHYVRNREHGEEGILPLVMDLTNPSPASGWGLAERLSSLDRLAGGVVVALALVHHLAIGNNVPLSMIASMFAQVAEAAVVEFVPKGDRQVRRLLATRADVFPTYTEEAFAEAFRAHFEIVRRVPVTGMDRVLFAMSRR